MLWPIEIYNNKNYLIIVIFLLFLAILINVSLAQDERIENFKAMITLFPDYSLLVKEEITYNFGNNWKNFIDRVISLNGVKLDVIEVKDLEGNNYDFEILKQKGNLSIRIFNNKEVRQKIVYVITYKAREAFRFFKDKGELYWNVTGNNWEVPIENVTAIFYPPKEWLDQNLNFSCYTGYLYSRESNCLYFIDPADYITFFSTKALGKRESLTAVVVLPKSLVKEITFTDKLIEAFKKYWFLFIVWILLMYLIVRITFGLKKR